MFHSRSFFFKREANQSGIKHPTRISRAPQAPAQAAAPEEPIQQGTDGPSQVSQQGNEQRDSTASDRRRTRTNDVEPSLLTDLLTSQLEESRSQEAALRIELQKVKDNNDRKLSEQHSRNIADNDRALQNFEALLTTLRKQRSSLERKLKRREDDIRDCAADLEEAKRKLEARGGRGQGEEAEDAEVIELLRQLHASKDQQIGQYKFGLATLEKTIENNEQRLAAYEAEIAQLRRTGPETSTIESYKSKIRELQGQLEEIVQRKSLLPIHNFNWLPNSVDEIDHKFEGILRRIKGWSKKYANCPFEHFCESLGAKGHILVRSGCIKSADKLREGLLASASMNSRTRPNRAIVMVLSAAVSCEIFKAVLGDPTFAFVGADDQNTVLRVSQGKALRTLMRVVSKRKYQPSL